MIHAAQRSWIACIQTYTHTSPYRAEVLSWAVMPELSIEHTLYISYASSLHRRSNSLGVWVDIMFQLQEEFHSLARYKNVLWVTKPLPLSSCNDDWKQAPCACTKNKTREDRYECLLMVLSYILYVLSTGPLHCPSFLCRFRSTWNILFSRVAKCIRLPPFFFLPLSLSLYIYISVQPEIRSVFFLWEGGGGRLMMSIELCGMLDALV